MPADESAGATPMFEPTMSEENPHLGHRPRLHTLIRPAIALLIAVVVFAAVLKQAESIDWHETFHQLRHASLGWFLLAFAAFHGGFLLRCYRWEVLLSGADTTHATGRIERPGFPSLVEIMYRAWFINTVTIARAGDAYRGYLLKRRSGASFSSSIGTIVTERIVDVVVLAVMLIGSILLAFHQKLPNGLPQILALAAVMAIIGAIGLLFLKRLEPLILRILPNRISHHVAAITSAMVGSTRKMPLLILLSFCGWMGEALELMFVARALGIELPVTHAATVALLTALLTTLPITPGGLGIADAGIIYLLQKVNVASGPAAAVAILSRVITFGSIVVIGGLVSLIGIALERRGASAQSPTQPAKAAFDAKR